MTQLTIGLSEAKKNLGKITKEINSSGCAVTVYKNNKPWVVISPANQIITNPETIRAMEEAERLLSDPNRQIYESFEDFMYALNKATEDA